MIISQPLYSFVWTQHGEHAEFFADRRPVTETNVSMPHTIPQRRFVVTSFGVFLPDAYEAAFTMTISAREILTLATPLCRLRSPSDRGFHLDPAIVLTPDQFFRVRMNWQVNYDTPPLLGQRVKVGVVLFGQASI